MKGEKELESDISLESTCRKDVRYERYINDNIGVLRL
jgi:hypothetical protein